MQTIVTTQQLADLSDLSPSFFTLHRAELPGAFDVPSASPQGGRPAKAYSLEDIAAFILNETSFLTEAEVRLRVAMSMCTRKRKSPMARFLDAHSLIEVDGVLEVVPRDHGELSPEMRAKVEALMAQEQAALRTRRGAKRHSRSTPQSTPQEMQP